jgi:hypothetical protein
LAGFRQPFTAIISAAADGCTANLRPPRRRRDAGAFLSMTAGELRDQPRDVGSARHHAVGAAHWRSGATQLLITDHRQRRLGPRSAMAPWSTWRTLSKAVLTPL